MKRVFVILILCCASLISFSQNSNITKAKNFLDDKKYETAREYIDQAVNNSITSNNKDAWYYRGYIYYNLSLSSSNPIPLIETSFESYKNALKYGYKLESLQTYLKALSTTSYNYGTKYYNTNDYNNAMQCFYNTYSIEDLTGNSDLTSLSYAALCANLSGNDIKSTEYYKMLYYSNYDSEDLYIRAPASIARTGDKDLALKILNEGKQKYPDNNSIIIGEINIYLALKENDKIILLIRKALEGNSDNASLYFALGTTYEQMEGYRYEAENAYKKAIEIDPAYFDAYYNLGALYLNTGVEIQDKANDLPLSKQKEYDELKSQADKNLKIAIPYLEGAYKIDPTEAVVVNSLKELYTRFKFNYKLNAINNNSLSSTLNKEVVNSPPEIIITAPSNSSGFKILDPYKTTNASVTISGQAIDDNGIKQITLNGRSVPFDNDGYFSQNISLTDGFNSLHIRAFDLQNNESQIELYFEKEVKTKAVAILQAKEEAINSESDYYALIIGVNDYDDPSVNDLDNPISDAQKFYTVITTYYTFNPENITFIKNPNRDELYDAFENLSSKINNKDNLLIFYAGHGHWDKTIDRGYWLPSDAKADKKSSWFSNTDLTDFIKSYKSKHTLLISDACFSGSIFKTRAAFDMAPKDVKILHEMPSRTAITSGTLTEVPDKSVFIEYLVKRLQQNQEKYLTTEGLFNSFRRAVISNSVTDQVPQYGSIHMTGDEGGEFIFIKKN